MDVLITGEARVDLEALELLGSKAPAWGFLVGHKRGLRFIVERAFPVGAGAAVPGVEQLLDLDVRWGGRLLGLYAVQPAPAVRHAAASPYFCGRLFLEIRRVRGDAGRFALRPRLVEFDGRFRLVPIALCSGPKGEKP